MDKKKKHEVSSSSESAYNVKTQIVSNFFAFRTPANVVVSGPSGSGKSELMLRIIAEREKLVNILPKRIIWSYSVDHPEFFKRLPKEVELMYGLPDFDNLGIADSDSHTWIIIDDQMDNLNQTISRLFTAYSHKKKLTLWLLTQNFYDKNIHLRNITLNAHYLLCFVNHRDMSQFFRIASQVFPRKSKSLIHVYEELAKTPYSYLLIDTSILCPDELRVRTDIFNPNGCIVFMLEDNK
jgi:hypothetical protein